MQKQLKVGIICLMFTFLTSSIFASPINLPTSVANQSGLQVDPISQYVGFSAGFLNDYVFDRKLDKNNASANFDVTGAKLDFSILNKFDFYTTLGSVIDPVYNAYFFHKNYNFYYSDNFMWGLGLSSTLYDWQSTGIKFFGDANFRESSGMQFDSLSFDGKSYTSGQLGSSASAVWEEWQTALGVSKNFEYITPYAGVVYSDVYTKSNITVSGTQYALGPVYSKDKIGPFVGVSITPTKWLSIDVDGRFVSEEAISGGVTIKF